MDTTVRERLETARAVAGAELEIEYRRPTTAAVFERTVDALEELVKHPGQDTCDVVMYFPSNRGGRAVDRVCLASNGDVLRVETKDELDRVRLEGNANLVMARESPIRDEARHELLVRSALVAMQPAVATSKDAYVLSEGDVERYDVGEAPPFFDSLRWLSAGRGRDRVFLNTPAVLETGRHLAFGEFVVRLQKGASPTPAHAVREGLLVPELVRSRVRRRFLVGAVCVDCTVVDGAAHSVEVEFPSDAPSFEMPAELADIFYGRFPPTKRKRAV